MRPLWIKAACALAAIWLVLGGIAWWARAVKPTPERIAQYIAAHPLDAASAAERRKIIDRVADQLNRLEYEERRQTRQQRHPDRFFQHLTAEEQGYFLDKTLPAGFKQMMEAFNKMTSEERKKMVEKALADMRKGREENGDRPAPRADDPHLQKMVNTGLKSFYSEANAETKMDLAPLIEEMHNDMQRLR